jgi:hypothetical protein
MDLKQLLDTKKISLEDYHSFILFEQNEIGREFLKNMIDGLFMEQPNPRYGKLGSIFNDGRRSVFQAIKFSIENIYTLLREAQ